MIIKKIFRILFGITILFYGCNNNQKTYKDKQKVIVKYNNGKIFCHGIYSINTKNGLPKNKIGVWYCYHPNGALSIFQQYDKDGELMNYKEYNTAGKLEKSGVFTKKGSTEFYYFDDGTLEYEWITRKETNGDESEEETIYTDVKKYYKNNQMAEQYSYIDDKLDGLRNVWNEKGNLELSINYENGFIVTTKK